MKTTFGDKPPVAFVEEYRMLAASEAAIMRDILQNVIESMGSCPIFTCAGCAVRIKLLERVKLSLK
jgi:hypothetical protein